MSIVTKYGDLLEAKGVIVHGCNAQGVMGSGVAKQIKAKWPEAFEAYQSHLQAFPPAQYMGHVPSIMTEEHNIVVNMITQLNYGRNPDTIYVDYEAVRNGFRFLNKRLTTYFNHDPSYPKIVNFPLIGCGHANGDWDVVSSIIDEELSDHLEKILWVKT